MINHLHKHLEDWSLEVAQTAQTMLVCSPLVYPLLMDNWKHYRPVWQELVTQHHIINPEWAWHGLCCINFSTPCSYRSGSFEQLGGNGCFIASYFSIMFYLSVRRSLPGFLGDDNCEKESKGIFWRLSSILKPDVRENSSRTHPFKLFHLEVSLLIWPRDCVFQSNDSLA